MQQITAETSEVLKTSEVWVQQNHGRSFRNEWCIRVGDYRVLYLIDDEKRSVQVTRVGYRRDVYDM